MNETTQPEILSQGERIKFMLESLGIRASEFSKRTGISDVTVSRWIHGSRGIGKQSAEQIAKTFPGFSSAWILGLTPYLNGAEQSLAEAAQEFKASAFRFRKKERAAMALLTALGYEVITPYDRGDFIAAWLIDTDTLVVAGDEIRDYPITIKIGSFETTITKSQFENFADTLSDVADGFARRIFEHDKIADRA